MNRIWFGTLLIIFLSTLESREMGDVVKGINLRPLEFSFPKINEFSNSSGVEFYSLKNSEFPIVYAELHIQHGKAHLGKRSPEIARFLEDTWELSGSSLFPKESFLTSLESLGASFSLTIDYDKTILSLSYIKRTEKEVLPIFLSFLEKPNLDQSLMETVRSKLLEEIQRRNDNPQSLGIRKAKESLFAGSILGTSLRPKEIQNLRVEDLVEFQKEILKTDQRRVLLTGDHSREVWENLFPKFPQLSAAKEILTPDILRENLKKAGNQIRLVEKDVSQSFLVMLGVLPKHNHPDFYAIQVLNYIIGAGGFNSYYMKEIRNNRGLAYSAGSNTDFTKNYGTIQFYAMTKKESVKEVLGLMKELIQPKSLEGIQEEELARAKNAIISQFVFQFEDDRRVLLSELRRKDHELPLDYFLSFRENIQKVRLEDLRRVGNLYFRPESLLVTVVGPKSLETLWPGQVRMVSPED